MKNFRLGLVSISFRGNSPEQILTEMNKAGLKYIEWGSDVHAPCSDEQRLCKIAQFQKEHNIICSSYGTYFWLGRDDVNELESYIKAAKILGTNILRLWCGNKNSQDYTAKERDHLFEQCRLAAKIAEKNDVIFCMECHPNTYTNKTAATLELMQAVNSEHFRMYWQPNQFESYDYNIDGVHKIAPYMEHVHVYNWEGHGKFPLKDGIAKWREYLKAFKDNTALLLEFMPDNRIESLCDETKALFEIVEAE